MMRRAQRWFAPVWVALVLALVPLGAAADEIEIRDARLVATEDGIVLSADFEFDLT